MHDDEVEVTEALVCSLLASQMPWLAELQLVRVEPWGTDHAIWRLGDELVLRIPRIHDARAGDFESADRRIAELIAIREAAGNRSQLLGAHATAAELAASRGDVARATSHLAAGAELAREMPSGEITWGFILSAAYLAYMDGHPDDAAVLYGARLARGHPPRPTLGRPILEALENQGLDEEIAEGAKLDADAALERAIEVINPRPPAPA
jgi:hypothetical protein